MSEGEFLPFVVFYASLSPSFDLLAEEIEAVNELVGEIARTEHET